MWINGKQKSIKQKDFNSIVKEVSGDLSDEEARILLLHFLKHNLGFTFHLLTGINLLPVQEIILKGLIIRDNALVVAGRGVSKSFIISAFCVLFPVFFSNSKLCLISTNFRNSRRLFENAEKMVRGKEADLLSACFTKDPNRRNDIISWKLDNGSEITVLPLSTGDGLRGHRSSCLCVDEGLLITREIQEFILRPFLSARQDFAEQENIRKIEDSLIRQKMLTEAERTIFPSNKYLVFSSASYEFEYLFEMYQNYVKEILRPKSPEELDPSSETPTYFVAKLSYEAMPEKSFLDMKAIEGAKANGGENSEYFKREYKAQFTSCADGYFNVKNLYKCRVKDGNSPTIQVKGNTQSEYILSIDPSYSKAANSDYFAMAVYMLMPETRSIMLVHSYGRAGAELNQHYNYLTYLLKNFNIVYTIIDGSGTEFIDSYNESGIAKNNNQNIKMFSSAINFNKENYLEMVHNARQEYNLSDKRFVYPQLFSSDNNRKMNEYLQAGIAAEKIHFASRICANDKQFNRFKEFKMPFEFKDGDGHQEMTPLEFLEEQDDWIQKTIDQLSLIEVRATASNTLQYDLPSKVKANDGPSKARRDNYTCCLLAYYGSKHYYDMIFTQEEEQTLSFEPFFV